REERERSEGGEDMAVFVKNVENVQGDERDIIVFSTTFGRNGQGSFRRNFGVLGQKGGERRLNVAVTRARRKVVMVTSMPISDISDMLSTRRAPAIPRDFLQSYLEYARTLSDGEFPACEGLLGRLDGERAAGPLHEGGSDPADAPQDGFKAAVAGYVRGLGWQLSPASEGDAFGLDYAIEDPRTGLYALGIECDAPRHALLARARAREIWRPSVLARAIARVHRVSSHGWYHDGDGERARLKAAIEAAMRSGMQAEAGAEIRDTAGAAPQALADSGAANRNVTADADAASAGVRS
ncbi:AAA domain-containing protein, partial [Cupriavidus basilensis]